MLVLLLLLLLQAMIESTQPTVDKRRLLQRQ